MISTNPLSVRHSETTAAVMVASGATLISFSAVFVKLAHVSPIVAGFYRNFFGGTLLLIILAVKGGILPKERRHIVIGVLCGAIFALDLFFWHKSIHYVGPGLATILANFQVFLLALFGVFVLGERLNARTMVAIPLAFCGLFLLAGIHWNQLGQVYRLGVLMGLAAAVCYAAYLLVLRKLQSLENAPTAMATLAVISIVAALLLGLATWLKGESFAIPDRQSFIALMAYGIFCQVIGWVLITRGLPRIRSSLVGLLILLQPSLSFTWDILFFKRPTDLYGGIGAITTLAAIYLGTVAKRARDNGRGRSTG